MAAPIQPQKPINTAAASAASQPVKEKTTKQQEDLKATAANVSNVAQQANVEPTREECYLAMRFLKNCSAICKFIGIKDVSPDFKGWVPSRIKHYRDKDKDAYFVQIDQPGTSNKKKVETSAKEIKAWAEMESNYEKLLKQELEADIKSSINYLNRNLKALNDWIKKQNPDAPESKSVSRIFTFYAEGDQYAVRAVTVTNQEFMYFASRADLKKWGQLGRSIPPGGPLLE